MKMQLQRTFLNASLFNSLTLKVLGAAKVVLLSYSFHLPFLFSRSSELQEKKMDIFTGELSIGKNTNV